MKLSKWELAMQSAVQGVVLKGGVAAVAFLLLFVNAFQAHAQATKIQQSEQHLQPAGDTAEHDTFGNAVAVSGNTMIIGAQGADGNSFDTGAAYIFDRIGNTWVQTAKLFAADGKGPQTSINGGADQFGVSVGISGDIAVVGAPSHSHPGFTRNSGAVYVFQRANGSWIQQAELLSPTPSSQGTFGAQGLGISGNTIVAGDAGNPANFFTSAVDVFTRTDGGWTLTTTLTVPDDFSFEVSSVAIDGKTVVVGSTGSDAPSAFFAGKVYVFRFSEGRWSGLAALTADDATTGANFGTSVGISGNLIVVGASFGPGATAQSGAAYIFGGEEGVWSQKAKLNSSDGLDRDSFGESVGISGRAVFVGAPSHTPAAGLGAGSAYVFQAMDGRWLQTAELLAGDGIAFGDFGISV